MNRISIKEKGMERERRNLAHGRVRKQGRKGWRRRHERVLGLEVKWYLVFLFKLDPIFPHPLV